MIKPNPVLLAAAAAALLAAAPARADANVDLAKKHNCLACHAQTAKMIGPSFADIAKKYAGDKNAAKTLAAKIKAGGGGVWGPTPMPPNPAVPEADVQAMVKWILAGAK